jgi:hypothetical protein
MTYFYNKNYELRKVKTTYNIERMCNICNNSKT